MLGRLVPDGRVLLLQGVDTDLAKRLIGFASMVLGIKYPVALTFQYVAVFTATALCLLAISQATIIEPPAFLVRAVQAVTDRLARQFATT